MNLLKSLATSGSLAALLASCLQAGAASALSFNFSFNGVGFPNSPTTVTGIVDGLADNTLFQTTGLTLSITSATNGPAGTTFNDSDFSSGLGFDVIAGQVTGVDVWYFNGNESLILGNAYTLNPDYIGNYGFENFDTDNSPNNSLVFTPVSTSVPGPLPLFGAAAAFGWSRQLRRRIKTSV